MDSCHPLTVCWDLLLLKGSRSDSTFSGLSVRLSLSHMSKTGPHSRTRACACVHSPNKPAAYSQTCSSMSCTWWAWGRVIQLLVAQKSNRINTDVARVSPWTRSTCAAAHLFYWQWRSPDKSLLNYSRERNHPPCFLSTLIRSILLLLCYF